jgi:hypothetical protein
MYHKVEVTSRNAKRVSQLPTPIYLRHNRISHMLLVHRTALRRRSILQLPSNTLTIQLLANNRLYHATPPFHSKTDPRLSNENLDNLIEDDYALIRPSYEVPKHPIILAHGLLGFTELHLAGPAGQALHLPGVQYWRGITDALAAKGVEVITAEVPPSGRIEVRAERLAEAIERKAGGRAVNIIACVLRTVDMDMG